ncbi:acetolactate synthase-1/2/3 large subunit [Marinobacterium lutimaris]|uniref:Acetolactate synthase-1/2/3 large subunit n=2 Tax=Marinobacterium lutimaris TaxID=568106 RepID=A0A1H6AJ74_9GAMM|nr:acetolactate synthase-1/2/3 large subunit [Marinobacterium lutimaris]
MNNYLKNVSKVEAPSAADTLLSQLEKAGVDYIFANGGTDFPPIVEAYCKAEAEGRKLPQPIVVPHENTAVAMAHGVYLATGKMQAVMVHVNVGTANTINAVLDASREQIPMLLMAGRSPYSEKGHLGTRTRYIHWAQEMFDQAGMIREAVKWDYELHLPDQVGDVVNRAIEVANSSPKGPVYLTLPRDILAAPDSSAEGRSKMRPAVAQSMPAAQDIERIASWLREAERPLIVTGSTGRDSETFQALAEFANRYAVPVTSYHQRFNSISTDHPFNAGGDPMPWVREADFILVLDCDVPWIPQIAEPADDAKVVHVGEDPIFARYPMRSFQSDMSMASRSVDVLESLLAELGEELPVAESRRGLLVERIASAQARIRTESEPKEHLTPEYISRVIGEVADPDAVIVNEYPLRVEHCSRTEPGTYFGLSPAGGLGWGLGAALGIKLASPEKDVICTMGDGAYIFTNPTASHWVAQAQGLPVLTIIYNNALHGAVRNSTLAMYPGGHSSKSAGRMLADLSPTPAFETLAGAEGLGLRVETVEELKPAIERALAATREGRQALINVICDY